LGVGNYLHFSLDRLLRQREIVDVLFFDAGPDGEAIEIIAKFTCYDDQDFLGLLVLLYQERQRAFA